MEPLHPLQAVIDHVGLAQLARELKVTHQAIRKWQIAGRMPRTEWTGETDYCRIMETLMVSAPVPVTRDALLQAWPPFEPKPRAPMPVHVVRAAGQAGEVADAPAAAEER